MNFLFRLIFVLSQRYEFRIPLGLRQGGRSIKDVDKNRAKGGDDG